MRSPLKVRSIRLFLVFAILLAATAAQGQAPVFAQTPYYYWWSEGPPRGAYRPYRKRATRSEPEMRLSSERRRGRAEAADSKPASDLKEPAKEKPRPVATAPAVPALQSQLLTVISISDQKVAVYDSSGVVDRGPVSTGQTGHRTPTGIFSIIQKNRYHHSNIYSNAPMPYMQRITWSGIAMHQGVLPGYPASHGCIRLPQSFAAAHFGRTKLGMRVIVSPEPTTAAEIVHARLPVPVFAAADNSASDAVSSGSGAPPAGDLVKVASVDATGERAMTRLLSPMERAVAARSKAATDVAATAGAAKAALETAAAKAAAAGAALDELRRAENDFGEAQAELVMVARALEQASDPEAAEHIRITRTASEERLGEAVQAMNAARAREDAARSEAFAAASAAREAEKSAEAAADAARASRKWTDSVSVFVSKREGRVFVRQGFVPIHEAPVEFKDKDTPIGTHLYVAMDSPDGGRSLKWKAVTVPNSGVASPASGKLRKGEEPPAPVRPRESAAGALERVVLPEEVRNLIADKLWPGASIIISDYGISNEQGEGATTDFIVLTR